MPKIPAPVRSGASQYRRGTVRHLAPAIGRSGGGVGWAILLSILFWLIFYQNLPGNLDGFASKGPYGVPDTQARIFKACMLGISAYVIATRWSLIRSLVKNINWGLAAFILLAPLSAVWSIEPTATLLRSVTLASVILVCFAASLAAWNPRRLQQMAIPPLMLILVGSLVVGMVMPDKIAEIGTDISQKGAWHGITHGKNEFGMVASLGAIFCVNAWLGREGRTLWAIAGTAIAFVCLILSRSNTSLLATIVSVMSMVLLMRVPVIKQRFSTHVVVAIAATLLLYELAIQNVIPGVNTLLGPIASLMGKDTTFSARAIIWAVIKMHVQGAPYLGTGYGAYWLGPVPESPSYIFLSLMWFYPTEAHNGYLDVVNDLGMLGLLCLLTCLFFYIRQALQLMPFDRSQAALYLALLFQEMVINMSESDWFSRTNTFAILALAIFSLSRALFEARVRQHS